MAVAAVGVAGCGGTRTVVRTVTAPVAAATTTATATTSSATTSTTATSTSSGPPECNAAGMNDKGLKQGTCISGGNTLVIVNKESTLHLKSLDVKLNGITTQDSLSNSSGMSATANGKFAIFSITLKNKLDTPQQWQTGQAGFYFATSSTGASSYNEDFNAENGPDGKSCLFSSAGLNGGIPPGESITCDVVFDVPASADISSHGSDFELGNFGSTDLSSPTGPLESFAPITEADLHQGQIVVQSCGSCHCCTGWPDTVLPVNVDAATIGAVLVPRSGQ